MNEFLFGGIGLVVVAAVALALCLPVGLLYVALRVRDGRNTAPDPHLGLKTAYHLLHSLAVVMLLTGLSVSAADLMQGMLGGNPRNPPPAAFGQVAPAAEFWTAAQRSAAALVGVGTLFALLFLLLLTWTNNRKYPAVRRTFVGGRLAVCLLVVFTVVTLSVLILVQKNPKIDPVELLVGILLVWLPAGVVHLFLFRLASRRPLEPIPAPPRRESAARIADDD